MSFRGKGVVFVKLSKYPLRTVYRDSEMVLNLLHAHRVSPFVTLSQSAQSVRYPN